MKDYIWHQIMVGNFVHLKKNYRTVQPKQHEE